MTHHNCQQHHSSTNRHPHFLAELLSKYIYIYALQGSLTMVIIVLNGFTVVDIYVILFKIRYTIMKITLRGRCVGLKKKVSAIVDVVHLK